MHLVKSALLLVAVLTLGAATVAFARGGDDDERGKARGHDRWERHDGDRGHHRGKHGHGAFVRLQNADGDTVGRVLMREHGRDGAVAVFAHVRDLPPGFHGFHIHTTGACERPDFTSAGGHFNPTGADHGDHAGDLPTLLVNDDGTGMIATQTDRFTLDDLRDEDGSAVMVHELADNHANIPERYGGPDEETLGTGDAGSRLACGELR